MTDTTQRYVFDLDLSLGFLPELEDRDLHDALLAIHNTLEQLAEELQKVKDRDTVVVTNADSPYTILPTDKFIKLDTSAGAVTVILPPVADVEDYTYYIKHVVGGSAGTIDGDGAETIDGAATLATAAGNGNILKNDGTEWFILASI